MTARRRLASPPGCSLSATAPAPEADPTVRETNPRPPRICARITRGNSLGDNTYFGGLLRPRAAFLPSEIEWLRFDVATSLIHSGLGAVRSGERNQCSHWLSKKCYAKLTIDCSAGQREVRRQLGTYFKWEEQFGYKLEEGAGNLDALRDGFDFDLGDLRGFALELVEPEATWKEDPRWFDGLLAIAVEQSRRQLALGHRFLTVLYVAETSALIGRTVEQIAVPSPWRAPLGAPATWSK